MWPTAAVLFCNLFESKERYWDRPPVVCMYFCVLMPAVATADWQKWGERAVWSTCTQKLYSKTVASFEEEWAENMVEIYKRVVTNMPFVGRKSNNSCLVGIETPTPADNTMQWFRPWWNWDSSASRKCNAMLQTWMERRLQRQQRMQFNTSDLDRTETTAQKKKCSRPGWNAGSNAISRQSNA